jgi:hypothetical protein
MENELEDGTRATFISRHSHPSLCSVRHRLCVAPMPVTTPPGAGGLQPQLIHPGRRHLSGIQLAPKILAGITASIRRR